MSCHRFAGFALLGFVACNSSAPSPGPSGDAGASSAGASPSAGATSSEAGSAGRLAVAGDFGEAGRGDDAGSGGEGGALPNAVDVWSEPTGVTLARKPPMGWNTWNAFHCNFDANDIRGIADALVSSGMKDAGYEFLNIDDCWQDHRDAQGKIVAGSNFPDGMAKVVEYIHGKGLKAGLYTTVGDNTCAGRPGSRGRATQDAATWASWGVDYAKIDWCGVQGEPADSWREWRSALTATKRPIVYSICTAGRFEPWNWAYSVGNLWRTTDDINPNWAWILDILDQNQQLASLARPGAWNDPDMLEVGNGINSWDIQSDDQNKTHFSLWAMMAAPLIAGNDLRKMTPAVRSVLTNAEVIAVDQDALGYQGYRVRSEAGRELWVKPLVGNGDRAVALFNRSKAPAAIAVSWSEIGLAGGTAQVRDLWKRQDLGPRVDGLEVRVDPDATVLLRVSGSPPEAPHGRAYLSDLQATYASNYWGPVELDSSNGEQARGDGQPLKIAKKAYEKGLGVHAGSRIRYRLGGRCTAFSTSVGVDDDAAGIGSVRFQVFVDGNAVADSGVMKSGNAAKALHVDVTNKQELVLLASNADDGNGYDHADWAEAFVDCAP